MENTFLENLFIGRLVRLASDDPEIASKASERWHRNPEYQRLMDTEAPHLWSRRKIQDRMEEGMEQAISDEYYFTIHVLEGDQLIGFVSLRDVRWNQRDAWVAIGIGDAEYWGQGYGTDAMRLALRYAFMELSLERVSLSVFASNRRAIRSYQKAGFVPEGLKRQVIHRDGRIEDVLYMGLKRQEWQAQYGAG
jgi:RimJ/RimL family protein N-acetyltransferase